MYDVTLWNVHFSAWEIGFAFKQTNYVQKLQFTFHKRNYLEINVFHSQNIQVIILLHTKVEGTLISVETNQIYF